MAGAVSFRASSKNGMLVECEGEKLIDLRTTDRPLTQRNRDGIRDALSRKRCETKSRLNVYRGVQ
jgi:hypothetical protein